jgi:hypothetical protein
MAFYDNVQVNYGCLGSANLGGLSLCGKGADGASMQEALANDSTEANLFSMLRAELPFAQSCAVLLFAYSESCKQKEEVQAKDFASKQHCMFHNQLIARPLS